MTSTSLRLGVLLATAVLCAAASAQDKPEDVTDAQMSVFRSHMEQGCTNRGLQRGDDGSQVVAFCRCVTRTFEQSLKRAEWQQVYWLDKSQKQADVQKVFAPYMDRLKACKTQ
jgi:hypothetical protein